MQGILDTYQSVKPARRVAKLCADLKTSRRTLEPFRVANRDAVMQYIGADWAAGYGIDQPVPVNLISLYIQVVTRTLVPHNPCWQANTHNPQGKASLATAQRWANRQTKKMRFAETLRRIVMNALFGIGIGKVGLVSPADSAAFGWNLDAGTPFIDDVDLDDFVVDMRAKKLEQVRYIGSRLIVPLDSIRDDPRYHKRRKKLMPSERRSYNAEGDERLSTLQQGYNTGFEDEFEESVEIWEIYCPRYRCIYTLTDDDVQGLNGDDVEPLLEQEWIGHDVGPYQVLGYFTVPGNAMPKGPVQDLMELQRSINRNHRKLDREADNLKTVGMCRDQADATRLMDASDLDFIKGNPDSVKLLKTGGADPALLQYMMQKIDRFKQHAGNLDLLGGMAPQSKTATQDEMLREQASAGIADLQARTLDYVSVLGECLFWFWWHHPSLEMNAAYEIPEIGLAIPDRVTPEQRQRVPWEDLDISVAPYSMQPQTPQQRAAALDEVVQQVLIPLAPLLQQQGIMFDAGAYLRKKAELRNMPDLVEIVSIAEPIMPQGASGPEGTLPSNTTRTYERRSLAGQSAQAKDAAALGALMGQSTKDIETNGAMIRPEQV